MHHATARSVRPHAPPWRPTVRPVVLRARAMPVMTRAQAADAAARQQHETLGGLIAQLRQLERGVGSEAYVVY